MLRSLLVVVVALEFSPALALAEERPIIAVFDMEDRGSGLKKRTLENATEFLSAKLAECGYQVIPRNQIRIRLLQEKKESYKECYDQGCQIDLGRELAAQKILSSKVMKLGKNCQFASVLFDLRRAATELAATGGCSCSEDAIVAETEKIAGRLCGALSKGKLEAAKATKKALSDFDAAMKRAQMIKERKDRVRNAWEAVRGLAGDPRLSTSTRAELLQKFMTEFAEDNPYRGQAQKRLAELLPGSIAIETDPPGAVVLVDGTPIGQAPLSRKLKAGSYKVSVSMQGYKGEPVEAFVEPGKEFRAKIVLRDTRPGELAVTTKPLGAMITAMSGRKVVKRGTSPCQLSLQPGEYIVWAGLKSYSSSHQSIVVRPKQKSELSFDLDKLHPGRLVISTKPRGARVVLDGRGAIEDLKSRDLGTSPLTTPLKQGEYTLVATLDGYNRLERNVTIEDGRSTELSLSLERAYQINPYKKWGHAAFWSGVGLSALGGVAAAMSKSAADDEMAGNWDAGDESRAWTGMMYTAFGAGGALVLTGLILWGLSPGDKEWFERNTAFLGSSLSGDAFMVGLGGRW